MALSLAAMAVVMILSFYLIFDSWYRFWLMSLLSAVSLGIIASGVVGCIAVYNMRTRSFPSRLGPDELKRRVIFHLRGTGYWIEDQERYVSLPLDTYRIVKVKFRRTANGSEVVVYPGLNDSGITLTFFLCVFLPFCGIGALVMAFNSYRMTSDFGEGVIGPTVIYLENQKEDPSIAPGVDLKLVMINTLQHADRLATSALLALKTSYGDASWLTVALGMLLYVFGMFGIEGAYQLPSTNLTLFWSSLIGTIAVIAGLLWHFRRVYYARTAKVRQQIQEIRATIAREQGVMPASENDESALSTVLMIWPELPTWARYRRASFFQRNPATSLVIAGMTLAAWQLGYFGATGGVMAIVLASLSVATYVSTKAKNEREDRLMINAWNEKVQSLTSMIEKKLGGL